jgi:8-oxo-dGTP pyrophosphatase MutT (NUDIX family)
MTGAVPWRIELRDDLARHPARALSVAANQRHAAVLVAVIEGPVGVDLLLHRRSRSLPHHAGQVAFPGGVVEPDDRDVAAAALREAQEEIGLDPESVEILGRLADVRTSTGYVVTPVVGAVSGEVVLSPSDDEVEEIVRVPAAVLLDHASFGMVTKRVRGLLVTGDALRWNGHEIWGATARVLLALRRALERVDGPWRRCPGT